MGQRAGLKTAPQVTATYLRIAEGLTRGQLDALLLVGQHLTSNEIASVLGISRHTVDQRIRMAMRSLGVKGRRLAARIVIEKYGPIFQWTGKCDEPFVLPTAMRKTRLSRSAVAHPLTAAVPPFEDWNVASTVICVRSLVIYGLLFTILIAREAGVPPNSFGEWFGLLLIGFLWLAFVLRSYGRQITTLARQKNAPLSPPPQDQA